MTAPANVNDCVDGTPTTESTTVPVGALVPQKHGGALRNGGTNKGGRGGIPSRIRAALRRDFVTEARPLIRQTVRGDLVHRMRVSLKVFLDHALCPQCDSKWEMRDKDADPYLEIDVQSSAPIGERLKAAEALAKYGLGTEATMTVISPDVQGRLQATLQYVMSKPTHEQGELMDQLEQLWR